MKKIYFIFNLQSGKAKIASKLGMIIDLLTKSGYEVTAHPTQGKLDATDAAEYACNNGFDTIMCSGGDGTLNEVIQGVMKCEKRLPIGYLPAGSTNDFAKGMEIPTNIERATQDIIDGIPSYCDIGCMNGRRYFTYIVAFGAFTEVTYETPQSFKNLLGHVAYVLNGFSCLNKIKSYHMKVTFDDQVIEDDYIYGMITNSSSVAGVLSLNDFLYDDGLYEVTLIKNPNNIIELHQIIQSLLNLDIDLDTNNIKTFRTSKIKFECDDEISWTIDGEYGGTCKKAEIENINKAVQFITKSTSELPIEHQ